MTDTEKLADIKRILTDYAAGRKDLQLTVSAIAQTVFAGDPIR